MNSSITTSDGCETFVRDPDYSGGRYGDAVAYITTSDPEHRVIIERQGWDVSSPWDWDTWLSCYSGKDDYAGKPMYHRSVNLWHADRSYALPEQYVVLGGYRTVHDLDDEELAEYIPTDGTVIGLDYSGGDYLRVSDSPDPRDWDGYFHITEAHWRALHGEPMTYTEREAHLRRGLAADCAAATAWINGDVYAWRLEHAETWTNNTTGQTRTTWETADSCGGYYVTQPSEWDDIVVDAFGHRPAIEVTA